ncbi:MAG: amidohydrolase [Chloroflexi bacterium]|nr:amidohydrolase [Chloroflexota bacterium]
MDIKYGLISCDSHAQLDKDAFTSRMSAAKWGDHIPHIADTTDPAHMAIKYDYPVERWFVHGEMVGNRGVVNCPTVMDDPLRRTFPQRWEQVPASVYDPGERLKAMDRDRLDGEVVFPNDPVQSVTFLQGEDPAFELECVRAYNDALAEWVRVSNRYVPLAIIPYLNGIGASVAEAERAVKIGHRGIVMVGEPSQAHKSLAHFNDPYWDPLWAACQDLDVPIHWHANAGLSSIAVPRWKGFNQTKTQAAGSSGSFGVQAQLITNLLFSGILERYPRSKWVCAETGLGWVNYILEGSDFEWERRHLWTEGIATRPSELFHRQVFVDFWYEAVGVQQRHKVGLDNIMWESDYPHSTSTWPESWRFVDRAMEGVPEDERKQLLYGNAQRLYKL